MKSITGFSQRLKQLMTQSGFSQEELADFLDISQPSVSNYLSGRIPPAEILYKMSRLFGVSMEFLLTGEHEQIKDEVKCGDLRVAEQRPSYGNPYQEVLEWFGRLDPEERKAILVILKKLAGKKNA